MAYRYYRIGYHLVCLDQSILSVIKTAILGHNRYRLQSIGVSRSTGRKAVQVVARSKFGLLNPAQQVVLPVFGQIAKRVHGGFKVFDFSRLEVSKTFSQETTPKEAIKEIAAGKKVSNIAAAPRFLAADPELGWYKEEYICGLRATDPGYRNDKRLLDFYPAVENCLTDLAVCELPLSVDTLGHIKNLADLSFRASWLAVGVEVAEIDEIEDYVEQLQDWLLNHSAPDELQLVLTHGDFSLVNAIVTDTGLRFVDWEGIARGGLYSDILNFLFVERYYGRASADFLETMPVFLDRYGEHIVSRVPELKVAASLEPTFARQLYYLERLNVLLQRNASAKLHKVVKRSIVMFREVDEEIGDVARQVT